MKNGEQFTLALVTGATSGIGLRLCEILADLGISLIVHGRNEEKLEKVVQELSKKVSVIPILAELNNAQSQNIVTQAIQKHIPDLVINNAGFGLYGEALDYDTDRQLDILRVDGLAVARFTLEAARILKNSGRSGVVMNISSAAAYPISPRFAIYSASKAFVNQFSESFDEEMKPHDIRILVACPGVVETNFRSIAGGLPRSKNEYAMTVDFAAQEIWKQIVTRKKLHVFNWYYRALIFMVKYIVPKSMVARLVGQRIAQLEEA